MKNTKQTNGKITSMKGGAVEIAFEKALPPLHALLTNEDRSAFFEVIEQKNERVVRAIALSPLENIERGSDVYAMGEISVALSDGILGRMFDLFGNPIDNKEFKAKERRLLFDNVDNAGNNLKHGEHHQKADYWKPVLK